MRRRLLTLLVLVSVLSGLVTGCDMLAQGTSRSSRYFPQVGRYVGGPFLQFYDALGGASFLGLPLTGERSESGLTVQYFENVRLEWNPIARSVNLSNLGDLLGQRKPPLAPAQISAIRKGSLRFYEKTGHTICPLFVSFYDEMGGPEIFGYPITELSKDDNCIVQYFERARFDLYSKGGDEPPVQLGPLGDIYLRQQEPGSGSQEKSDRKPQLWAIAKYPMTGKGGHQTVSIRLLDVAGHGIAGVPFEVIVHAPWGDHGFTADPTDAEGYTSCTFPVGSPPSGYKILVDVVGRWQGHSLKTRASYIVGLAS